MDLVLHFRQGGAISLSVSYSATLLAAGIRPSVGTTGDFFDNALSESLNGLYKTELIWALGVQDDEIAL